MALEHPVGEQCFQSAEAGALARIFLTRVDPTHWALLHCCLALSFSLSCPSRGAHLPGLALRCVLHWVMQSAVRLVGAQ